MTQNLSTISVLARREEIVDGFSGRASASAGLQDLGKHGCIDIAAR